MRFKSQAQAGFGACRQGTWENYPKVPHDGQQSRAEHDTTRADTIWPIPLPLYKYALLSSPLSLSFWALPSLHANMCVCTHEVQSRFYYCCYYAPREALLQINVHTHQQGTAQNRVAEAVVVVLVVDAHRSV